MKTPPKFRVASSASDDEPLVLDRAGLLRVFPWVGRIGADLDKVESIVITGVDGETLTIEREG
jgi:hypothetical protein